MWSKQDRVLLISRTVPFSGGKRLFFSMKHGVTERSPTGRRWRFRAFFLAEQWDRWGCYYISGTNGWQSERRTSVYRNNCLFFWTKECNIKLKGGQELAGCFEKYCVYIVNRLPLFSSNKNRHNTGCFYLRIRHDLQRRNLRHSVGRSPIREHMGTNFFHIFLSIGFILFPLHDLHPTVFKHASVDLYNNIVSWWNFLLLLFCVRFSNSFYLIGERLVLAVT